VTPGESARLAAEASRLEAAEEIAVALDRAIDSLRGEGGAEDSLGVATDEARKLADRDPELEPLALRLDSARLEIADVAAELSRRIVQPDPQALADTRERLDVISRMRRKYGDTEEEVLAYLERSERRVEELSSEDTDAALWEERSDAAIAAATAASLRLGELRRGAAAALRVQVEGSLAELAMPDAVFEVVLEERELYEGGMETIRFDVTANKGEAPKPLAKVASGGELSRIALALHLADPSATATTTVFDEVDAGVGGGAAQAVGRSLAEVARNSGGQVIVVTHLPQVAAFADNHLRVTKVSEGGRTRAEVERVADDARVQELSRMLAGMPDSEVGREHARELLALAGGGAPGA
jgi:DNA repair protein RecN (Recombination protein N)